MKSICVYCGSNAGNDPHFEQVAAEVGASIARRGMRLVYGGGNVGLMGTVADACLEAGGEVLGVIPEALVQREKAHLGLTDLIVVENMHQRKETMMRQSDGFLAMPGGIGTLEELFEVFTWLQLDFIDKPCGLLNIKGYYDPLLAFLDNAVAQGFLKQPHRELLHAGSQFDDLIEVMLSYEHVTVPK